MSGETDDGSGQAEHEEEADGDFFEIAFNSEDLSGPSFPESVHSESPPESIMVEKDEETRWKRRHKHVVDGEECDTPTRHGPFTSSSLFEFIASPANSDRRQNIETIQNKLRISTSHYRPWSLH